MKQRRRNEEDEMMRALEGINVSGQVAPDAADGNRLLIVALSCCRGILPGCFDVFVYFLRIKCYVYFQSCMLNERLDEVY